MSRTCPTHKTQIKGVKLIVKSKTHLRCFSFTWKLMWQYRLLSSSLKKLAKVCRLTSFTKRTHSCYCYWTNHSSQITCISRRILATYVFIHRKDTPRLKEHSWNICSLKMYTCLPSRRALCSVNLEECTTSTKRMIKVKAMKIEYFFHSSFARPSSKSWSNNTSIKNYRKLNPPVCPKRNFDLFPNLKVLQLWLRIEWFLWRTME